MASAEELIPHQKHTMKKLLKLLLLTPAALFAAAPVPTEIVPEKISGAKPRNVVFILSDDHRYDAMSFMGHQFAKTPVMDSLAANGAHIKNALVTTALCSPSRASILTGLYTFRHRVIDNNRAIPKGTVYFPQYLQKAGYATSFIGKWHMDGMSFLPLAEGKSIPWRKDFLYVYYWEKNFPQTPTTFSIRGDRYKYITYYGLWDSDEFFDIPNDPDESRNLLHDPAHKKPVIATS